MGCGASSHAHPEFTPFLASGFVPSSRDAAPGVPTEPRRGAGERKSSKGRKTTAIPKRWKPARVDALMPRQKSPRSSMSMGSDKKVPEGVSLPPSRRDHEPHIRNINRYLNRMERWYRMTYRKDVLKWPAGRMLAPFHLEAPRNCRVLGEAWVMPAAPHEWIAIADQSLPRKVLTK
eukprot:symbB.v1.2.036922.t1/scaffold5328.1/size28378/1